MLDIAIAFLADEFNAFLQRRTGSLAVGRMLPGPLVDDTGKLAITKGTVGLALINIEEERATRAQLPERVLLHGREMTLAPELRLNLTLLAAADMSDYDTTLKALSQVLTFFQSHPVFTVDDYPGLDPRIGQLSVDMLSVGHETLNQIWAALGAKYLPSVIYRVRLVALQDREPERFGAPITDIAIDLHDR
jgi:hypothetical protein